MSSPEPPLSPSGDPIAPSARPAPVDPPANRSKPVRTTERIGRTRDPRKWLQRGVFLLLLALLSLFRFRYASSHGLVYDEAYYWLWARKLAPGYYDQGPGVALAIRFGLLFGHSTGAVRLAAVLDAALVSVLAYALASRIFRTETAGLCAGLLMNAVPLLFVGGILITHDSPQMASWAVGIYALARAVGIGDSTPVHSRPGWWLLTGLAAGISMDCKFTAVLFLPFTLLFLWISPARPTLRTPWPYLAALLAVVVFIPPIYWNATHHWASAKHILNLGGAHEQHLLNLRGAGDFLGGQVGVSLLFFFTLALAAVVAWRRGRREGDTGLLLAACFSGPVWLFFFLLSLHGQVEPNWPVPSYFTATVVAPWLAIQGFRQARGGKAVALGIFHLLAFLLAALGITVLLYPMTALRLPNGRALLKPLGAKSNEMYGADQLARALVHAGWTPLGPWLPAATRYQEASELSFALPGQPTTYNLPIERRRNQFDFWSPLPDGSDALVVVPENATDPTLPQLQRLFRQVGKPTKAQVWRRPLYPQPIAEYEIYPCHDYHGGRDGLLGDQW